MIFLTQVTFVAGHEEAVTIVQPQSLLERLMHKPVQSSQKKRFIPSVSRIRLSTPDVDSVFTVPTKEREELRAVLHACTPNSAAGIYTPYYSLCGREFEEEAFFDDSTRHDSIEKALRRMDHQHPAWLQPYVDQVREVFQQWAEQGFTHVRATVEGAHTRADLSTLTHDELINL